VELAKSSFDKILHPAAVSFGALPVIILVLSVAVKVGLWLFNGELSKLIRSTTLMATAQDSRNDAIATLVVLLAGVIQSLTGATIDGWMGMAVALFILYSGVTLAKETISPLLGETASPELRELIVDYIRQQPKVLGYHDLMVHDYGPGQRFATLHVEMSTNESPLECHELIDDMERECYKNHGIHLVIHYDPVITADPELTRFRAACEELLRYNLTKCFMGTNGVDHEAGFTTPDIGESMAKRSAMRNSRECFVLCTTEKFHVITPVRFADIGSAKIITNRYPDGWRGGMEFLIIAT
jgi:hypothetical protein